LGVIRDDRLLLMVALRFRLLLIAPAIILAGCGTTMSRPARGDTRRNVMQGEQSTTVDSPVGFRPLERDGGRHSQIDILAKGRLPGGATFVITAVHDKAANELAYHADEPSWRGERRLLRYVGGGGVTVGQHGPVAVLELAVAGGCVAWHPYALAYGILGDARDSVTAHSDGRSVRFAKVALPAYFHFRGAAVYALLVAGRNWVVIQAPDGRAVHSEWRDGAHESGACGDK
jgi:hypothetical protein